MEGYKYLQKRINGKGKLLHRIVMEEFLGRELTSDEVVHHINKDTRDNRIDNLEIATRSAHAFCHVSGRCHSEESKQKMSRAVKGRRLSEETKQKISNLKKGSKNPHAILNEGMVIIIKQALKKGIRVADIAKVFCVSINVIFNIKSGRRWGHVKEEGHEFQPALCRTEKRTL
jgi:hypothetical protein